MSEKRVGVVTQSSFKVAELARGLGDGFNVVHIPPLFQEQEIHGIPHTWGRVEQVTIAKARDDNLRTRDRLNIEGNIGSILGQVDWLLAHNYMGAIETEAGIEVADYTDVINYLPGKRYIAEKPRPDDYDYWLLQALLQSGETIHIIASHTMLWRSENGFPYTSFGTLTQVQTREYTRDELKQLADPGDAWLDWSRAAGGIPLALTAEYLYDQLKPLKSWWIPDFSNVAYDGSEDSLGQPILELNRWDDLNGSQLTQFVAGTTPQAIEYARQLLSSPFPPETHLVI